MISNQGARKSLQSQNFWFIKFRWPTRSYWVDENKIFFIKIFFLFILLFDRNKKKLHVSLDLWWKQIKKNMYYKIYYSYDNIDYNRFFSLNSMESVNTFFHCDWRCFSVRWSCDTKISIRNLRWQWVWHKSSYDCVFITMQKSTLILCSCQRKWHLTNNARIVSNWKHKTPIDYVC